METINNAKPIIKKKKKIVIRPTQEHNYIVSKVSYRCIENKKVK